MASQPPATYESLLVSNLGLVERIVQALCRRHAVAGDDCDEFASRVNAKLIEDDYAVLRKFRGESSLATYLTVVIAMLLRDFRVERWGRWRPSAEARRNGPLAVRLEALIYRDAFSWRHTVELLHTSGDTTMSERELKQLFEKLPRRSGPRPRDVELETADGMVSGAKADESLGRSTLEAEEYALDLALTTALASLSAEDGLILRMRYWEGLRITEIGRVLGYPPKPLYRRVERALAVLRRCLEELGVSRDRVDSLFSDKSAYG